MAMLRDQFPEWVCSLCESQGISRAILTLASTGDTTDSQAFYGSIAARLSAWGETTLETPSNETLPDIIPLPEAT